MARVLKNKKLVDTKLHSYEMKITCKFCESIYKKVK